jgi:hypothetical protein
MGVTGATGPIGVTGVNYKIFNPPLADPGVTGQVWWDNVAGVLKVSGLV